LQNFGQGGAAPRHARVHGESAADQSRRAGRRAELYQFTLRDTDTAELYRWAPVFEEKMRQAPSLEDVSSDLQVKNPQIQIDMDHDKISALGLTVNQVETALYNAYGTRQVSQIYAPNNHYQVVLQVASEFQKDPAALSMLYVRSSSKALIPLATVAKVTTNVGPLSVSHTGQLPSVTISFNLKPGIALGNAVSDIQTLAAATLPSTVTTSFQGAAQAFQDSLQGLGLILVMAIVVIYLVLGVLYESFTHPLTILSGLPSAGFGALLTLLILKTELSLYAFVGIIMLVGLVKKNGIMGGARRHAADRAWLRRLRRVAAAARAGGGRRPARIPVADALCHACVLRLYRRRALMARAPASDGPRCPSDSPGYG
jgi:HAE1 family hydrophobic/amphiphilic exporter-1